MSIANAFTGILCWHIWRCIQPIVLIYFLKGSVWNHFIDIISLIVYSNDWFIRNLYLYGLYEQNMIYCTRILRLKIYEVTNISTRCHYELVTNVCAWWHCMSADIRYCFEPHILPCMVIFEICVIISHIDTNEICYENTILANADWIW